MTTANTEMPAPKSQEAPPGALHEAAARLSAWIADGGAVERADVALLIAEVRRCQREIETQRDELYRLNEALQNSEAWLSLTRQSANAGTWEWNPRTNLVTVTLQLALLHGAVPENLQSYQDWRHLIHPDDILRVEAARDQAIAERRPFELEFRVTLGNGEIRWLVGRGQAIYDEQGEVVRVIGVNQDITARKRAELALLEERADMKALLENTDGSIWAIDANYRLIACNSVFVNEGRQDFAHEYAVGDDVLAHGASAEAIATWKARYDRALRGEAFTVDTPLFSDPSRWMSFHLNPIRSETGEVIGVTVYGRDITEHKRAEERIREQLAEITFYYDNAPIGMAVLDRDLRFVRINKLLAQANGVPAAEHIGRTVEEIVPDVAAQGRDIAAKILATGEPVTEIEISGETPAQPGVRRYWKEGWYPVWGDGGAISGFSLIAQEVTETRQALEALKQSRRKLARAQEIGHMGSWEWDAVNQTLTWSDELYRIFGVTHDFVLTHDAIEALIHPEDRAEHDRHVQEALVTDDATMFEFRIVRPDGGVRHIAEYIVTSLGEIGNPANVFGVMQDITERKLAELEREQLLQQLAQAQKMEAIGRLAGGIAHEFNNLLAVILMRTEMAISQLEPSLPLHRNLTTVYDTAQRSAELVRQLLGFAGKQVVSPEVIDLNVTIETILPSLRTLTGGQIELRWLPGRALWPVEMDKQQLEQVLLNLCQNARDAIDGDGVITMATANSEPDESVPQHNRAHHGYVKLVVTDTGRGMDQATLSRIFEPFFTTKEVGKGVGLGLPMVQGIVQQNGGWLDVSSQPGRGATFTIYLPRCIDQPNALAPAQMPPLRRGHGETVLVVENDSTMLQMATEALEFLGYHVIGAPTLREALQWIASDSGAFDLLMMDFAAPEMQGVDLSGWLAVILPGVKCLLVCDYPDDAAVQQAAAGADTYFLQKPYSLPTLAETLHSALGDTPQAGSSA